MSRIVTTLAVAAVCCSQATADTPASKILPASAETVEVFDFAAAMQRTDQDPAIDSAAESLVPSEIAGLTPLVEIPDLIQPASLQSDTEIAESESTIPEEPGLFIIPPAPSCEIDAAYGSKIGSSDLFQPISAVTLTGRSSKPLVAGKTDVTLDLPENAACAYLGDGAVAAYFTEPMLVSPRPHRSGYPLRHNPLYFADENLERCGRGWNSLTNARSMGLFSAQIVSLPLQMALACPRDHVRALPDCPSCHRFKINAFNPLNRLDGCKCRH